jgi:UDP-N-acetylglucosamine 2-epimerase (non-hydrolysing)
MTQIIHVVGARPNFMKAAPVYEALKQTGKFDQRPGHTGQHYDSKMSDVFFEQLNLPRPDVNLEVGSGSHSTQTAQVMVRFEEEEFALTSQIRRSSRSVCLNLREV